MKKIIYKIIIYKYHHDIFNLVKFILNLKNDRIKKKIIIGSIYAILYFFCLWLLL